MTYGGNDSDDIDQWGNDSDDNPAVLIADGSCENGSLLRIDVSSNPIAGVDGATFSVLVHKRNKILCS